MEFLFKKFKTWFLLKEKLHAIHAKPPYFNESDIWWCSMGENIGVEVNGKSELFSRPVLVLRKLSRESFLGIPLTSQEKKGTWYVPITQGKSVSYALLNQVRLLSTKRLSSKMGSLDEIDFNKVKSGFIDLIL
ncbi:MAG: type II toxin-antitoxin system PemK/MazF family toxin [bacterium]